MMMTTRSPIPALLCTLLLTFAALPARADLISLSAGGTITTNTSGDSAIPVGTPWTFQLTYDTAAPDLDFLTAGSPDPTFGQFTNTALPPALTFFHYHAGTYDVTIDNPSGFATGSALIVTFTTVHALDINIFAPALFPSLGGKAVSFHADFNAFSSAPIFTSDGLPTNTAIGPASFDQSTVSLLPSNAIVIGDLTSFSLTPVPEPWTAGFGIVGLIFLLARRAPRLPAI